MPVHQVITIHSEAPTKPALGGICNGCGVCCLAEPCPLGVLLSLRRKGPCAALRWSQAEQQYRCGALGASIVKPAPAPAHPLRDMGRRFFSGLRTRLVARWIAAGFGCDCALETAPSVTISASPSQDRDPPHD